MIRGPNSQPSVLISLSSIQLPKKPRRSWRGFLWPSWPWMNFPYFLLALAFAGVVFLAFGLALALACFLAGLEDFLAAPVLCCESSMSVPEVPNCAVGGVYIGRGVLGLPQVA